MDERLNIIPKKGLRLLMITMLMSFIMAALIIPCHFRFNARAKQAEAKSNLNSILKAQQTYYDKYANYAYGPHCFELLNWEPRNNLIYNYYCGGDSISCEMSGCEKNVCFHYKLTSGAGPTGSAKGFTIYAVGNVDSDSTDCDVWTINDARDLRNRENDVAN